MVLSNDTRMNHHIANDHGHKDSNRNEESRIMNFNPAHRLSLPGDIALHIRGYREFLCH